MNPDLVDTLKQHLSCENLEAVKTLVNADPSLGANEFAKNHLDKYMQRCKVFGEEPDKNIYDGIDKVLPVLFTKVKDFFPPQTIGRFLSPFSTIFKLSCMFVLCSCFSFLSLFCLCLNHCS